MRSRSIFTGSSSFVKPSRCERRRTCVSTTIPCGSPSSDELVERPRHLAAEVVEEHSHRPSQRLRLLVVEACREDVPLELLRRDREVVLGPGVLLEQRLRDTIDIHVGRLRREHHGHEQLERVGERERDRRVLVLFREALDDRPDPLLLRPDALARLADEATRHC
jgi:hypothetical protein